MKRQFTKTIASTLCALALIATPFSVSASEINTDVPNETVQFLYEDGTDVRFTSEALSNPNNFIDENGNKLDLPSDTNQVSLLASCSHVPFSHVTVPLESHVRNNTTRLCSVSTATGVECSGCGGLLNIVSPFRFAYNHYH